MRNFVQAGATARALLSAEKRTSLVPFLPCRFYELPLRQRGDVICRTAWTCQCGAVDSDMDTARASPKGELKSDFASKRLLATLCYRLQQILAPLFVIFEGRGLTLEMWMADMKCIWIREMRRRGTLTEKPW